MDAFRASWKSFGCITFKGSLVGGPPCFGDMESCLIGFGNGLLLLIYLCMIFMFIIYSMFWMFIDYYKNALFIRSLTCMYSILRHPCLIWTITLVFSLLFSYHIYHSSNNMWIDIIIMFMFIMLIYILFYAS